MKLFYVLLKLFHTSELHMDTASSNAMNIQLTSAPLAMASRTIRVKCDNRGAYNSGSGVCADDASTASHKPIISYRSSITGNETCGSSKAPAGRRSNSEWNSLSRSFTRRWVRYDGRRPPRTGRGDEAEQMRARGPRRHKS